MAHSETTTRVLVAVVAVPIVIGAVMLGGWALALLLAVVSVLVTLEFYRLAEAKGTHPLPILGSAIAMLFVLIAALAPAAGPESPAFSSVILFGVLATGSASIWARGVAGQPVLSVSVTFYGAVYAGGLLSFGLYLRHLPGNVGAAHGAALVLAPVVLTWASDTFAYFVGRAWGTRKLIPSVSPGKTVQGALGAVLGTVAVAVAYSYILGRFPTYRIGLGQAVALGLFVSVAAQLGDLAESLFKRDAGVKDSGRLFPGHGGALDRLDSLLYTIPLGYLYFRFLVGASGPFY